MDTCSELADGLWIVSGGQVSHPWDASAYLIAGDEPTLIDCGSTAGYDALKSNLARLGYAPADIHTILATHGHWDHLSAAAALQSEGGARLLIHDADRAQVETGDTDLTAAFLYDRPFPPARVDGLLRDGDRLAVNGFTLTVHHTPGHSPGSVCFRLQHGGLTVLVAGDTLWGHFHPRLHSDLDAWRGSLDRLTELDYDALTIGHSAPRLWFDAKRRVLEARQQFGVFFNPWFKPFNLAFQY
jgi:glyoxylase-like metal-dependent hydrolase (beta-lactamase superfamily II)